MKITAILGSPRQKSNSTAITRRILDKAQECGAEISEFKLSKLNFSGCKGCETCKTKLDRCVLKDDLTPVLDAIRESDVVILATPNYFGEVSGQFKCFFDRTYSFLNPDFTSRLESGKKAIFVFSQGQADLSLYQDVFQRYNFWLNRYGFQDNEVIRMNGPREADSLQSRSDLIKQADELGKSICSK